MLPNVFYAAAGGTALTGNAGAAMAKSTSGMPKHLKMALVPLFNLTNGASSHAGKQASMAYVLEDLVNYGKANGPWTDRTSNLRRSYAWEIVEREGQTIGIFANIASYAIFLEFKAGYWVLSGAIKARAKAASEIFGIEMDPKKITKPVFVKVKKSG